MSRIQLPVENVRVPSGPCPISFTMFWDLPSLPPDQIICEWFMEVRQYGLDRGTFYSAEAISYWATEFGYDKEQEYIEEVITEYEKNIQ